MPKRKLDGVNHKRIVKEPMEARFVQTWRDINKDDDRPTLAYLLDPEHPHVPDEPSERDWEVAGTVVQWLGSPVGQGFVMDAMFKRPLRIQEVRTLVVELLERQLEARGPEDQGADAIQDALIAFKDAIDG